MAGYVKADRYRIPGSTVLQLHARVCPGTNRYAEVCQQYDPHSGVVAWCKFMYGLEVTSEAWHQASARTPQDGAKLLSAADDSPLAEYGVLCLCALPQSMEVGAIRKR